MCLYMSSNVLTFRNIVTATDGEPVAPVSEVRRRSAFGLASVAENEHLSSVPAAKLSTPCKKSERSERYGFPDPQGGLTAAQEIRKGLRNLCYFLSNRLSRYCFLSCNRCSCMFNNGHLFTFNAIFIFSHRSSSAFSIAAKSFMVLYRKDVLLRYSHHHVLLPQV